MVITTLLIFLLDWISKNTDYDASVFFNSKIIELNTEEFERIACKGKCQSWLSFMRIKEFI